MRYETHKSEQDVRARWFVTEIIPHETALRRWLERRVGGEIDVEDIIQESYSILAGLEGYAAIRHSRAYLFQTARSVLIRHVKRARIVPFDALGDMDEGQLSDTKPLPDQVAADREALRALAEVINALPAQSRKALILRRVHGLSQRDIAKAMGLSESTVEKHLAKAVKLLVEWRRDGGKVPPQVSKITKFNSGVENGPKTDKSGDRRTGRGLGRPLRSGAIGRG